MSFHNIIRTGLKTQYGPKRNPATASKDKKISTVFLRRITREKWCANLQIQILAALNQCKTKCTGI
jgi:hypothetical protein